MTVFNEKEYLIGTAEYGANFWNAMRGIQHAYDKIHGGANGITGGYALPSGSNEKLQKAITQESLFRSMATVIKAYNGASRIFSLPRAAPTLPHGCRRAAAFRFRTV